ncbi:MAG: hypothetical protein R8K49_01355 [Mariprofundaceae bacterium]
MLLIRGLIAIILLVLVFSPHSLLEGLFILSWLVILLYTLCFDIKSLCHTLLKSWRLLRWILLPTLLLHILFTPGEMIFHGFVLALSYEGMLLGLSLSLHLCQIFLAALVLGQLFPISLWYRMIVRFPYLDHYCQPYFRLVPKLLLEIRVLIRRSYRAWCLEPKKLIVMPQYLAMLSSEVEYRSHVRAIRVHQCWDQRVETSLMKPILPIPKVYISVIWVVIGAVFELSGDVVWM